MGITNFQGSGTFIVGNKRPIYETEKGLLISDLSVPINYNFKPTKNGLESEVHWMKLLGFGSFAEAMQKANVVDLVFAAGVITYESYENNKGEFVLKTVMKVNSFSIVKAKYTDDEEQQPEKPKKKLVSNRR